MNFNLDLQFEFKSKEQKEFFFSRRRNHCFSGGFGNGKSFIACLRMFLMLANFPGYRCVIAREVYGDLRETTMKTFFKICPGEFVASHNVNLGTTVLKNGSTILWSHLDAFDEQSLRGLEINSALIDQAEEIQENMFYILDSRIGRWDQAMVPQSLKDQYFARLGKEWPKDGRGKDAVPNFFDILCNPDTKYHWIYKKFHPDSPLRDPAYGWTHAATNENLNDPRTIEQMLKRDPEWVAKYYKGEWGASTAQIHYVDNASVISMPRNAMVEFMDDVLRNSVKFRSLDHGEASPTCCLWVAHYKGVYIFYREYYMPNQIISEHRRNISDLSGKEEYSGNYADPQIFKRTSQKDGGFWSTADEYLTNDISAPPLVWQPSDNNEFATRNRINELLVPSNLYKHPVTEESPAPGIYFVKRSPEHTFGCYYALEQLLAQRREEIGSDNGRILYGDKRDDSIVDHAYDAVRYFVSMHARGIKQQVKVAPARCFKTFGDKHGMLNRNPRPLGRFMR